MTLTTIQLRGAADDRLVVEVKGELDLFSAPRLKAILQSIARAGSRAVVVDVREVVFVDSAGLGVLVSGLRIVRAAGGSLALCCSRKSFVRRVLEQTRLSTVFALVEDPAEPAAAESSCSHLRPAS